MRQVILTNITSIFVDGLCGGFMKSVGYSWSNLLFLLLALVSLFALLTLTFQPSAYAIEMVWNASVRENGVTLKLKPQAAILNPDNAASLLSDDLTLVVTELSSTKDTIYTSFRIKPSASHSSASNRLPFSGYWEISKNSRSEWMGLINGALVTLKAHKPNPMASEFSHNRL